MWELQDWPVWHRRRVGALAVRGRCWDKCSGERNLSNPQEVAVLSVQLNLAQHSQGWCHHELLSCARAALPRMKLFLHGETISGSHLCFCGIL